MPNSLRSLNDRVAYELGIRIIRGDYKTGEAIPIESALSSEFGVSRTVLREAVKTLAAKGLVESRPKTGTRVLSRQEWSLLDPDVLIWGYQAGKDEQFLLEMVEVRRILEPAATTLASVRATDEELTRLEELYQQMEAASDNTEAYVQADLQFHVALLAASHNDLLQNFARVIDNALLSIQEATFSRLKSSRSPLPVHFEVMQNLLKRDPKGAETAMRRVIDMAEEDIRLVLVKRKE